MSQFSTNPYSIKDLLTEVEQGNLGLPEFQRRFKWDRSQIRDLLVTVMNDYPAGSLLFYCPGDPDLFGRRAFEGAPALKTTPSVSLALDGQQRLTSLFSALRNADQDIYLLRIDEVLNGSDPEDWVTYAVPQYRKRRGKNEIYLRHYWVLGQDGKFERHDAPLADKTLRLLPLPVLVGESYRCTCWLQEAGLEGSEIETIMDIRSQVLNDYKFPVITLGAATSPDRVCFIFEKVNSTGLKLSLFELLNAKLYRTPGETDDGMHLADMWARAKKEHQRLERFGTKDLFFLQTLALFHTRGKSAPGCKRKDIFALTVEDVRELWEPVLKAVDGVLQLMEDKAGIRSDRWFPFPTVLPALAALYDYFHEKLRGKPQYHVWVERLLRWYWCSVFSNRYGNAVETKLPMDVRAVIRWVEEDVEPDWIKHFRFSATSLRQAVSRSSAVYQGVFCLVLRQALDFHSGMPLTWERIKGGEAEDHHIFPRSRVKDRFDKKQFNGVLNRTLIDRETNRNIRNKMPSTYFPLVRSSNSKFNEILRSHSIPMGDESPEKDDDFLGFLDRRERLIGELIEEATGCQVVDYALGEEEEGEGSMIPDEGLNGDVLDDEEVTEGAA